MSFFVTAIAYYPDAAEKRYHKPYNCTHTFGHFPTLEEAISAVERNVGGMDECLYNYLLIEEIGYGIYAGIANLEPDNPRRFEWWYRWEHPNWVATEKPDWSGGIICWAIG